MSYNFLEYTAGAPDQAHFEIDSRKCEEQVGGFPYVHIWQYFIRT